MKNPEVQFNSPDEKHPGKFKLGDIIKGLKEHANCEVEVYLEWHEGTYGRKIPVVIVREAR